METLIYSGTWLRFTAITKQSAKFLLGLPMELWDDFVVSATILENAIRDGRSPGGRSERVKGSRVRLWELRVTPKGSKGPQIRLLYVRVGRCIFIARAVDKRSRQLKRRDIELADAAVLAFGRAKQDA